MNVFEYRMILKNYFAKKPYILHNYPTILYDDNREMLRIFTITPQDKRYELLHSRLSFTDLEEMKTVSDICYPCEVYEDIFTKSEREYYFKLMNDRYVKGYGKWYEVQIIQPSRIRSHKTEESYWLMLFTSCLVFTTFTVCMEKCYF